MKRSLNYRIRDFDLSKFSSKRDLINKNFIKILHIA